MSHVCNILNALDLDRGLPIRTVDHYRDKFLNNAIGYQVLIKLSLY